MQHSYKLPWLVIYLLPVLHFRSKKKKSLCQKAETAHYTNRQLLPEATAKHHNMCEGRESIKIMPRCNFNMQWDH